MDRLTEPLFVGVYDATPAFRAIDQHSCVCYADQSLVASTGPAGDRESQRYAELFASAPAMRQALEQIAAMQFLPIGDAGEEMSSRLAAARIAAAALAKARGEEQS